jgi:hypothetical protein
MLCFKEIILSRVASFEDTVIRRLVFFEDIIIRRLMLFIGDNNQVISFD